MNFLSIAFELFRSSFCREIKFETAVEVDQVGERVERGGRRSRRRKGSREVRDPGQGGLRFASSCDGFTGLCWLAAERFDSHRVDMEEVNFLMNFTYCTFHLLSTSLRITIPASKLFKSEARERFNTRKSTEVEETKIAKQN